MTTSTFTVAVDGSNVAGAVSYSERVATFTPEADWAPGATHTVTLSTGITDAAGNGLAEAVTWTFTTEPAPVPPFALPFAVGKRWLYEVASSRTVMGSSIGVRRTSFTGTAVVHVKDEDRSHGLPSCAMHGTQPRSGLPASHSVLGQPPPNAHLVRPAGRESGRARRPPSTQSHLMDSVRCLQGRRPAVGPSRRRRAPAG